MLGETYMCSDRRTVWGKIQFEDWIITEGIFTREIKSGLSVCYEFFNLDKVWFFIIKALLTSH